MKAIHIVECFTCGNREEIFVTSENATFNCSKCGGQSRIVYDWGKCNVMDVFVPYYEDNLGDTPVYIESREQLSRECEKRGLRHLGLEMGYKSYSRRREI